MTRIVWIEAPAGIAGDMCLGALVDAGLPLSVLEEVVQGLGLDDVQVRARPVLRGAIAATKVDVCRGGVPIDGQDDVHVHAHGGDDPHAHGHGRTLAQVCERIGRLGPLDAPPLSQAVAAFQALAEAEAQVHGTTPEAVHFHEVGAADALVDIVGTCVGLHHLGIEAVYASELPWGSGTVETAHGTLPIPAPATVRLLTGWPTMRSEETYEQVTPTGAALVRALARGPTFPDGMRVSRVGHGAGGFDGGRLPNVVRMSLGTVESGADETQDLEEVVLLETNVDDVSGQVVAHALACALEAGAHDAWWTAIHMKKGRPGVQLSVLCAPSDVARLEALLYRETATLGIRRRPHVRSTVPRSFETVTTAFGPVRMKVRGAGAEKTAVPEYEDCRRLAAEARVALRAVMEAAQLAWADER